MCGISGYLSFDNLFSEADLRKMTSVLAHRGPDADGQFIENNCGLGFKRLSIIDVSDMANQPMLSLNMRFVMVYNGEIYNYKELTSLLDAEVIRQLKSTSDTEIVLELFSKFGINFVSCLNGMFSIAIYDRELEELFFFRDRSGIKPLYYYWDGTNVAFASEIKALLQLDFINKKINRSAITAYLHLGYVPAPLTAYSSIFKMQSGSMIKISKKGLLTEKYWSFENKIQNELITDEKKATEELENLLMDSVAIEQRSDVPLGIFLSGGTDSSLIAALASRSSNKKIKTFSIGFHEDSYDESKHARIVAQHCDTDHHEFIVSYKDAISLTGKITQIYDEPYADSSAIPTLLVSKFAKEHVTVALSGDGADELFHGYGFYTWAKRLSNPVWKISRTPVAMMMSLMSERYKRGASLLNYDDPNHIKSHIFSQEQYFFSESEIKNLMSPEYKNTNDENVFQLFNENFHNFIFKGYDITKRKNRKLDAIEEQALFDIQFYLQDDLLTKIDRASMHHSLEVRVPYLDYRIVEFALNLTPALKIKKGVQKYLLKKILFKHLPESLFKRPKRGFSIPLSSWLKNELKYLIDEFLSEHVIRQAGIVRYPVVKKYVDEFMNGRYYYSSRIWSLIVLHQWINEQKENSNS